MSITIKVNNNHIKIQLDMQRIFKTIMLLALFTMALQYSYAQTRDKSPLIATWTFDYETALRSMDENAKTHYSKMDTSRRTRLEELYRNRKLTFLEDGTYVQEIADGRKREGTWKVKDRSLVLTDADNFDYDYSIVELSDSRISIKLIITGKAQPLLTTLHFTKN